MSRDLVNRPPVRATYRGFCFFTLPLFCQEKLSINIVRMSAKPLFTLFLALALGACERSAPATEFAPLFVDVSEAAGLDFIHFNGMSGELYFPEMMGAGVALFDYDDDGDIDIYLVQGHMLGPDKSIEAATFRPPPGPLVDRLYRNDTTIVDGAVEVRLTDVTEASGIYADGYGMGVATGDYDNDGDVDLYVTNFGSNQLWRNEGNGRFSEVTRQAGVDDERWSVSAAFVDYDGDGWLDLYVGNYVDFSFATHKPCKSTTSAKDYCSPQVYTPQADSLFRNLGNGSFADVSAASGIASKAGSSLGVVAADLNADALTDLYVANDGMANFLWLNQGSGRFVEGAELAGAAVNMGGSPEASMGVSAADFDRDGDVDLFMTHLNRETNTLYVNDGKGWFEDRTVSTGLGEASFAFTGFGTGWLDYDMDGWPDLFVANGAVTLIEAQVLAGDPFPLKQGNQLFRNLGPAGFADVSKQAGDALNVPLVSRGAALGDLDNDGDTDIVVANNSGPAQVLLNQVRPPLSAGASNWVGVVLNGGGRPVLNARLASLAQEVAMGEQRVHTDGSYASASDARRVLLVAGEVADIIVRWPDGQQERFNGNAAGRYHTLTRGKGLPTDAAIRP